MAETEAIQMQDGDVERAARELGAGISGEVLLPSDEGYEAGRKVWNAMHDRRPAVIVRPRATDDVVAAVAFARRHGLTVAVRGGGHSVAGYGTVEDGLVIDHVLMRGVRVDPQTRIVRAEPGATLADVDRATQEHGLAVPIGVISATGIAGLTLGGGIGWLTRPYGLTVDNLVAAELVAADGSVVRASEDEEPELFWGLRGGGGNFGIVTSFELRAFPLGPTVYAGNLIYHRPRWTDALRAFRDWTADLPDQLTAICTFLTPPASWEFGDETVMIIGFAWAGTDDEEARRLVDRLRGAVAADVEVVEPAAWVDWQSAVDELFPSGVRAYWKNLSLDRLDDGAVDAIIRAADAMAPRSVGVDVHHMGGAVERVAEEATAFPNRTAAYWVNFYGVWDAPADDDAGRAWARAAQDGLRPHAAAGEYVNFLGASPGDADVAAAARSAYGDAKLERLAALKQGWDPDNVFRLNHNIEPSPRR
ncbi:MAG: FAD-binding oxidoreductase [Chloroflexota bacterium]|nr:FAD-binding oxidoreductase [Chloroflexota bacterium]